jgi:hypothetical protein
LYESNESKFKDSYFYDNEKEGNKYIKDNYCLTIESERGCSCGLNQLKFDFLKIQEKNLSLEKQIELTQNKNKEIEELYEKSKVLEYEYEKASIEIKRLTNEQILKQNMINTTTNKNNELNEKIGNLTRTINHLKKENNDMSNKLFLEKKLNFSLKSKFDKECNERKIEYQFFTNEIDLLKNEINCLTEELKNNLPNNISNYFREPTEINTLVTQQSNIEDNLNFNEFFFDCSLNKNSKQINCVKSRVSVFKGRDSSCNNGKAAKSKNNEKSPDDKFGQKFPLDENNLSYLKKLCSAYCNSVLSQENSISFEMLI